MADSPGLLGMRPSRYFKIFRTDFPAIFRFNGKLFMEYYDIDNDRDEWREVSEEVAMPWLRSMQKCKNPNCPELGWCGGTCPAERF